MAREVEQGHIAQAIQATGDIPSLKALLVGAFIENSSINIKDDIKNIIAQASQPDPVQQEIQLLQLESARLDVAAKARDIGKTEAEIDKIYADIRDNARQTDINAYNAVDKTQTDELDRQAFGRDIKR